MACKWDRLCSSPDPESSPRCKDYVTALNSPRLEQSLTKSVCSAFGSKPNLYVFLRRRVGDGKWKLCKFENWKFELIQGAAAKTGFCSLLGNKRIQFGFGKSIRSHEPELWGLVLDDRDLIPVDRNMHHYFKSEEQHVDFLADGELLQLIFHLKVEFLNFAKQFFFSYVRNNGDSCELRAWSRNSTSTWTGEKLSLVATRAPLVVEGVPAPVELSRQMQRLVMGIHDYDFIVGNDAIFIMKDSQSSLKVVAELARLTELRDSQQTAILLDDDNTMMLMRTLEMQPQASCIN